MTRTTRLVAIRRAEVARRRPVPSTRGRRLGAVLGVVLSLVLVTVGLAGVVSVSALGVLSSGLPDPSQLGELAFAQPTIVPTWRPPMSCPNAHIGAVPMSVINATTAKSAVMTQGS